MNTALLSKNHVNFKLGHMTVLSAKTSNVLKNSTIQQPMFVGDGTKVYHSVPYVHTRGTSCKGGSMMLHTRVCT